MRSLPKPLIGLLLSTVVFFGLWIVALKPSSSTSGGSPSGVGQYQSAINKAHQAVATSNAANAKLGAPVSTVNSPAPATHAKTSATTTNSKTAAATKPASKAVASKAVASKTVASKTVASHSAAQAATVSVADQLKALQDAVVGHQVVAILFYNPAAADDQAMKQELAASPAHGGQVVKLAVPVTDLSRFEMVTSQIPVVTAPTLIVIDATRQATTITGFASQLEINQRIADALAAK